MRRVVLIVLVAMVAAIAGYFAASRNNSQEPNSYQNNGRVHIPRPTTEANEPRLKDTEETISKSGDPVSEAVTALLNPKEGDERAIPNGTKLLSLKIDGGVATLDFSSEFNGVRNYGNTRESLAQNSLRKTLAQFPEVQKMLVRVEGKPFESEHTDWTEPISVRDSNASGRTQ